MKLAVVGSRNFTNATLMTHILNGYNIEEIISGGAVGADFWAKQYALDRGITYTEFPAEWKKYGNAAGPIRNKEIVAASDRVVAFWDGKSRGTKMTIDYAKSLGKIVNVIDFTPEEIKPRPEMKGLFK